MWQGIRRVVLVGVAAVATMSALAPGAWASITPALSLDQSAGNAAGSTANLGVHLTFAPSSGDSPDAMTLNLPPGLLANASINGGACLTTKDLNDTACEVGSGTVTANAFGFIPITTPVTFDLVPPPAPGDLAGLAVNSSGSQIGSTADIKVRPSGDPNGVGVTINFVLPNSLFGTGIQITDISSTFDGLRYPTTCPATPQSFSVSVNSYSDPTVHTVNAPLSVTRCSSLPYAPQFAVTAARDKGDNQVRLVTHITQAATEATSQSVTLAFPFAVLAPNVSSVALLCPNLSTGTCTSVGSVTASSPLYPKPLTGQAYLTGAISGPSLTLVFPSPFPLKLIGSVKLTSNTTTFAGLPDIPLTDLAVTLNSGPRGLFLATCKTLTGTATAALTDQNGDKSVTAPAKFTVTGCPSNGGGGSGGGGGGGGGQAGNGGGGSSGGVGAARAKLTGAAFSGLRTGHPALRFKVGVARGAAKLRSLTVELPSGLSFARDRVTDKLTVTGASVVGGRIKSLSLSRGQLVITLRKAVSSMTVKLSPRALKESATLEAKAKSKHLRSLLLRVIAVNAAGKRSTIAVQVKNLGL
jgi:uncharacterized membrane protein YgcG